MSVRLWFRRLLARIEAATSGYLVQVGWIETRAQRVARDTAGRPTPWFTYPAIRFLDDRVEPAWRVLEFGAGMGTLWWSSRVREVVAVEHDAAWATQVSALCDASVLRADGGNADAYVQPALGSGPYDVVIVDGLHRNECLAAAADLVAATGVIVLDDAQREEYRPGIDALRARGFRMLELHGPQPVSKHPGCTAILYRDGNVLGL
jgi:predicted O-methyltransferase YrrM